MRTAWLLLLAFSASSSMALEIDEHPSAKGKTATEVWLQLQARNEKASKTPQSATPKEREQSMQRWLDSYKYAIPDFYRWESVGSADK